MANFSTVSVDTTTNDRCVVTTTLNASRVVDRTVFTGDAAFIGDDPVVSQEEREEVAFIHECKDAYDGLNIGNTPLGELTPLQAAIAVTIGLSDFKDGDSVFTEKVFRGLTDLPVENGEFSLNLLLLMREFIELCFEYYDEEFAESTFNSHYKSWASKEDFDQNFHLTGKERHIPVKDAKFVQIFKMLYFVMFEHYKRFFEISLYKVKGDESPTRTSLAFEEYLERSIRVFEKIALISLEKTEIRDVFREAKEKHKVFLEERDNERQKKKFAQSKTTPPPKKDFKSLAEEQQRLDKFLKESVERNSKPHEQPVDMRTAPSVWARPVAAKVALSSVQQEQQALAQHQASSHQTLSHQASSHQASSHQASSRQAMPQRKNDRRTSRSQTFKQGLTQGPTQGPSQGHFQLPTQGHFQLPTQGPSQQPTQEPTQPTKPVVDDQGFTLVRRKKNKKN